MEGSVNVTNAVLDKKMDRYGFEEKNFVAESEITVTITLDEYRDLVRKCARSDYEIEKANKDKYERDSENKRLKEEVEALRVKIYALQNPVEELPFS